MSIILPLASNRIFRATLLKYLNEQVAGAASGGSGQGLPARIAALETSVGWLEELYWDDLRFPAQAINPAGSASPPSVNSTDGMLDFIGTGASDNIIAGFAQMPHAWKEGTEIHPHIHIKHRNAAAGNSLWKFEYDIANVFADFAGTYTSSTVLAVSPTNVNRHHLAAFPAISMTGRKDSCGIMWRITRVQSDPSDTFGHDIGLLEFDIHYQSDGRGSYLEYPT